MQGDSPSGGKGERPQFFSSVATQIRMANCRLQPNFKGVGNETTCFLLNTTIGLAGFFDPVKKRFHINKKEEDFV